MSLLKLPEPLPGGRQAFNPNTVISYQLPARSAGGGVSSLVTLKIYDVLGNEVATLINEKQNAGTYKVEFDGSKLSSGVYYYQLRTNDFMHTKKMLLIK